MHALNTYSTDFSMWHWLLVLFVVLHTVLIYSM